MKIERIDKDRIKCTLSKKDLALRNININELAYGNLKARRLFQDMMRQAYIQFGFEAHNSALLIEAIPISEGNIVLNISKVEEPDELDSRFSRFSPMEISDTEEEEPNMELSQFNINSITDKLSVLDNTANDLSNESNDSFHYTAYFIFDSLKEVIWASKIIQPHFTGLSHLLKQKENYILLLQKQNMSNEVFGNLCNILSDCGKQEDPTLAQRLYYSNYSKTLLENQAIETLAKL